MTTRTLTIIPINDFMAEFVDRFNGGREDHKVLAGTVRSMVNRWAPQFGNTPDFAVWEKMADEMEKIANRPVDLGFHFWPSDN